MNTFHLVISSPDGALFDGRAQVLSLRGALGDLAIMAGHAPFVTSVQPGVCRVTDEEGRQRCAHLDGGLLAVDETKTGLISASFHWDE